MSTCTDYEFWRRALAGERQNVQENAPQCGFYKRRTVKNGPWLPAAICRATEAMARAGGVPVGTIIALFKGAIHDATEQWTWICSHPVSEEAYRFAVKEGRWPDEPEAMTNDLLASAKAFDDAERRRIEAGRNEPADPFSRLMGEAADKIEQAKALMARTGGKIAAKVDCDMAANIAKALTSLKSEADGMHKAEKTPLLQAAKDVDGKFRFRDELDALTKQLKAAAGAWMAAEERRIEAEARAKAEAERAQREAERKALEAQDPILAAITPADGAPKLESIKVQAGGARGSKMGLRTVYVAEITDYEAALKHFASHSQIKALIQSLAQGVVRSMGQDANIPGVTVRAERKAV